MLHETSMGHFVLGVDFILQSVFPYRLTIRSKNARILELLVMEADHAHWHKTALSMRLPLGMRELFFLPALSWLPGHPPAQELA
jgi:hypothetical protein